MRIIVLIVSASLFLSSCDSGKPPSASPGRLPFGNVDVPTDNAQARGSLGVGGWALSEDGIEHVRFYLDRQFVGEATLGVPRLDVAKVYPGAKGNGASGWNGAVDVSQITAGQHELVVQASSTTGATRDLGVRNIVVQK